MTTVIFNSVQARIQQEKVPERRARLGQFIVEVIRHMPQLTLSQAASTALQIADSVEFHTHEDHASLVQMIQ